MHRGGWETRREHAEHVNECAVCTHMCVVLIPRFMETGMQKMGMQVRYQT
jgi:hypothetical protein